MGIAENCLAVLSLCFGCALLAYIPLTFGVGYGAQNLFLDWSFNQCLDSYNPDSYNGYNAFDYIETDQPSHTELFVIKILGYIGCFMICCSCCIKIFYDEPETKLICVGIIQLLNAFIGSCLFMHVYTYLHELDEKVECMGGVDTFYDIYDWAIAGVVVGSVIVSLTICACCLGVLARMSASGEYQPKPRSITNRGYPGVNNQQLAKPLVYVDESGNPYDMNSNYRPPTNQVQTNNYNRNDDPLAEFDDLSMSQKRRVVGLVSLAVVEECGFVVATENNRRFVLNKLNSTQPAGQTALRDAVILGVNKLLQLKVVIARLGVIEHKFIHIVLTDGADNRSNCTLTDAQGIFMQLGRELGDLCTTFFIGVGLGYTEKAQLQSIANLAGDAAELYNCQDVQLKDVFDRIKIKVGIQREIAMITDGRNILAAQRDQLYMTAEHQKFLVLFTLDKSGSMSGTRWSRVCGAVQGFCQGMGDSDIIGVVLFNDKVICITD